MSGTPSTNVRAAPPWRLHALLLAAWLGTFWLAAALEHAPHASLWFPPAAVTFAGVLVAGWRALPMIFVACAVATWVAEATYGGSVRPGVVLASTLAFSAVHVAAYGVPAALLRNLAREEVREISLRSVTEVLLAGAVGAALAAFGGVLALRATGLLEADGGWLPLAAAWWLGDYAALVTLAPVFIALFVRATDAASAHPAARFPLFQFGSWRPQTRTFGKLALLLGLTGAILGMHFRGGGEEQVLLALLVVPLVLQLWIVHTEDHATALGAMVAFALLTVGIAAAFPAGGGALVLQFAAVSLAANTYLNLAVPSLYADNVRLREQVAHDRLTGALSRAWIEERANRVLAGGGARRSSLVMFDLDGLKAINDSHGHATGDAVLREVVARCSAVLRPGDLLGRLGGDEFVVLLPGAGARESVLAVDRMRATLADGPLDAVGHPVTASFGIAAATPGSTWPDLLHRADVAMYADKRDRSRARD